MTFLPRTLLASLLVLASTNAIAHAQTPACTLKKDVYTCDKAAFKSILANAKVIAIETRAQDRMAASQLRELIQQMHKTVATPDTPADLTFSFVALNTEGVLIGPAGLDLAALRVYGPAPAGQKGDIVWAETYTGQPDMSWPATVHATIQQFREGFKRP